MSMDEPNPLQHKTGPLPVERIVLVGVTDDETSDQELDQRLDELCDLAAGCGGCVVACIKVRLKRWNPAYVIGKGKLEDVRNAITAHGAETVLFNVDLKGSQQRNLEKALQVKVIDRTQLILDIFARHAKSQEGRMQVELAQLRYLLPRLVGHGEALSRLGGGIGTVGPGETKLEVDRRHIGERIGRLQNALSAVAARRALKREHRKRKGVPIVALVGYTNAGKSTLLNALTHAQTKTHDGLFTTLDPLSRRWNLPHRMEAVLTDTVGFMEDLPHTLIEAFKATLEEAKEADLLLIVVDVTAADWRRRLNSVFSVLKEIGADRRPHLIVFNKIDRIKDEKAAAIAADYPESVLVSARTGQNLDVLCEKVVELLSKTRRLIDVVLPIDRQDLVSFAHEHGEVQFVRYTNDRIEMRVWMEASLAQRLAKEAVDKIIEDRNKFD